MKYTVEGFLQSRLVELGLDVTDAAILRWFVDFNATGMMKKITVFDDTQNTNIDYYWVKFAAVMEDLPTLFINNIRVMSRRFQKLVDANVLQKYVIKNQHGSFACFRVVGPILEELLRCDINPSGAKYNPDEDDLLFEEIAGDLYHEKTTEEYPSNEADTHRTLEYGAECEKDDETDTHRTPEYGAHGTPEYGALNNQSIRLNQSIKKAAAALNTESDKIQGEQKKQEIKAAAAYSCFDSKKIQEAIEKIWPLNVFDDEFIPKAARYLHEQSCGELFPVDSFVQWLKKYVDNKKPDSPWGLFYSLFFKPDILQKFKADPAQHTASSSPKRANTVICPVCGREFSEYSLSCPDCELLVMEFDNHNIVHIKKQLRKLPEDIRSLLEQKIIERTQNAMRSGQFSEISSITAQLFSEFGIQKEVVT